MLRTLASAYVTGTGLFNGQPAPQRVSVEPAHAERAIGAVRHARNLEAIDRLRIARNWVDDYQL